MAECKQETVDALNALRNMTICCICTESYTDPRMLPCSHTYCFKCLPMIQKGNVLQCALCRKQFDNLSANLEDLPRNAIIQEVLDLSQKISRSGNEVSADDENGDSEWIRVETNVQTESHADAIRCNDKISTTNFVGSNNIADSYRRNSHSHQQSDNTLGESAINDTSDDRGTDSAQNLGNEGLEGKYMENQEPNLLDGQNRKDMLNSTGNKLQNETDEPEKAETMSVQTYIACEICAESAEGDTNITAATVYCTDCEQCQCDKCSKEHKKQKLMRSHCIVTLDEPLKIELTDAKKEKERNRGEILCEVCAEDAEESALSEIPKATMHCTTCSESQCDECSRSHKKQKNFKSHQIVVLNDQLKEDLLKKNELPTVQEVKIFCDVCKENCSSENESDIKIATLRCKDCCENQCAECSSEHRRQRLSKNHQIIEIDKNLREAILKETTLVCDVCAENNYNGVTDLAIATQHCIDCTENQCDQCSKEHKRQRSSKTHTIVPLDDEMIHKLKQIKETEGPLQQTTQSDRRPDNTDQQVSSGPPTATLCINDCTETEEATEAAPTLQENANLTGQRENSVDNALLSIVLYEQEPRSLTTCKRSKERDSRMNQFSVMQIQPLLKDKVFSRIQQVTEKPATTEEDLANFWENTMPFVIQRIKMWNGDVITAQNLASLVQRSAKTMGVSNAASPSSGATPRNAASTNPVSRLDCLTYIVNAADFIVAQDIFRILSKFPIAIPFVVQNISKMNQYIVTTPLIQNNVVKWESAPGQIAENYLFLSRYRLIVALRLGTNKLGKSTILNQLMRKQFVFSSKGEAGSKYGRPRTLDGSVEIVWLTQETCSDITWKSTMLDFYRGNMEEVAILANLHGDALEHADKLTFLTGLACSFIVFLMPDFSLKQWGQLKKLIAGKISVHLLVDPKETTSDELCLNSIHTDSLSSDDTQETMRSALRESLSIEFSRKQPLVEQALNSGGCLQSVEKTRCIEAEEIIQNVTQIGCFKIRQILNHANLEEPKKWDNTVKQLLQLFISILCPYTIRAKTSLMFLETHLSRLSATESANARADVSKAKEKLRRFVQNPSKSNEHDNARHNTDLKEAQEELKLAMEKVDNINLGQEHFFRVLGQIYEKSVLQKDIKDQIPSITDLPSCFAELLINGQAIEMLNGDSGELQLIWIKAICESVCKKLPNLKVFVISIIGLQSSGKSTLLNALFSCRFAVSVGRCSRGLFMRMIFLDDDILKTLGCDCIILIDTEGLCSPEKMNDPKASQKDRLMATFAMGVSNLAIVNILGEGMTEMTEILQISIIAMARLRSGGIKPDILMVQHLQERNVSKVDQAKGQFCDAVNKAFELINKNDIEIGSASAECLAELTARIQSGDLFQHFGPFKDGSSVNAPPAESYHEDVVSLFETLMKRVKAIEKKLSFERWSNHFESYWTCVKEEKFALNFKNVKHITDFLYFEKKTAKVKELLDNVFRKHSNAFAMEIKNEISVHVAENKRVRTELNSQKIFDEKIQELQCLPHRCRENCEACKHYCDSYDLLLQEMSGGEWEEDTKNTLRIYHCTLQERAKRMLRQIFQGSAVRQGCFSEFSDIITSELNQALKNRPDGIYSPKEQEDITANIWGLLQGIANSKETGTSSLDDKFFNALYQEYVTTGKIPNVMVEFEIERTSESLRKTKAEKYLRIPYFHFRIPYGKASEDLMKSLLDDVEYLVKRVFQKREEDYLTTGLDFDEAMIRDIRTKFPYTVGTFEKRFQVNLLDHFKFNLQMYALQQFKKQMNQLQDVWNRQNRPTEILLQKMDDYIAEIKTTLEFGFTCAGEGKKVAVKLSKAVEKSATTAVYNAKVDAVRNSAWTTNSEKVRLIYFEELAEEVKAGKKERALKHFLNPERAINEWYSKKVDSVLSIDKLKENYKSVRSQKLDDIVNRVQHSPSKEDIDEIIEFYVTDVEDRYSCPLNPKDNNFYAYKDNILRELMSLKAKCKATQHVKYLSVSNNAEVRRRLGCTKHCFWCGALCWGSPDHQLEKERNPEMECHHSCHQPSGLIGVHYRYSRELVSISCHNRQDYARVHFDKCEDDVGIPWSEAKKKHFPDWKFDAHCITKFDELMRWFFQELHRDIAKSMELLPAASNELAKNGCTNLNMKDILNVVRSKI